MKAYGRIEADLQAFLTSALDENEWSASHPDRFAAGELAPSTHWICTVNT